MFQIHEPPFQAILLLRPPSSSRHLLGEYHPYVNFGVSILVPSLLSLSGYQNDFEIGTIAL
ncbi:MAG: hypothetical protein WA144_14800, partial [Candidatus Methanoperedens sp.]